MSLVLGPWGFRQSPILDVCAKCGKISPIHDRLNRICFFCFMGLRIEEFSQESAEGTTIKTKVSHPRSVHKLDLQI